MTDALLSIVFNLQIFTNALLSIVLTLQIWTNTLLLNFNFYTALLRIVVLIGRKLQTLVNAPSFRNFPTSFTLYSSNISSNIRSKILLYIGFKLRILFPLLRIRFHAQIFVGNKNDILFRHCFFLFYQYFHV